MVSHTNDTDTLGGLNQHYSRSTDQMTPLSVQLFVHLYLLQFRKISTMTEIRTRFTLVKEGEGHGASQQRGDPLATDIQDRGACANYTPQT